MTVNLKRTNILDKLNAFDQVVNETTSTRSVTADDKDKIIVSNRAAGVVFTLPDATAATAGNTYAFYVGTTITSNAFSVVGYSSDDIFYGNYISRDNDTAFASISVAPNFSSNYQLTSNGTTTGGLAGSWFVFTCLGLEAWLVSGEMIGSGTVATAFAG